MPLPDYLIIGAQRCGTSSMMHYISRHPGVGKVPLREVKFFYRHYGKGWQWYGSLFGDEPGLLHGEKSPSYIINRGTPERVKGHDWGAKFIVLLRNPVDRILSQYRLRKQLHGVEGPFDEVDWNDGYMLQRGHYAGQLRRWFSFFPRDRFLVLKSEEFFADTKAQMNLVWRFLGLKRWHPKRYDPVGRSELDASMSDESRERLVAYYRPHVEELEELLGWGWEL
jgi:hypothetical protein